MTASLELLTPSDLEPIKALLTELLARGPSSTGDNALTLEQTATALQCSVKEVVALKQSGHLPGTRYGNGYRFSARDLELWVSLSGLLGRHATVQDVARARYGTTFMDQISLVAVGSSDRQAAD